MAHEMTSTDTFAGYLHRAWHRLGTLINEALEPEEMLTRAGMAWSVEQWALSATDGDGRKIAVPSHVLNVRSDNHEPLGVVGIDYEVFQNIELARTGHALVQVGDSKVITETVGSFRGGRRVYMTIRTNPIEIAKNDITVPYLFLANGHDGGLAIQVKLTNVRVVCSNTFHWALAGGSNKFRHTTNVRDRIEAAKAVIMAGETSINEYRERASALVKHTMTRDEIKDFFISAWAATEFDIGAEQKALHSKDEAKRKRAHRRLKRAREAIVQIGNNFDRDVRRTTGEATAWNAFNAFSEWQQKQRTMRGADEAARYESHAFSDAMGDIANKKQTVFKKALALV